MALSATHAKRDAIVLQNSRGGFASAPNSPRIFLQPASRNDGRCAEQADQTVAIGNSVLFFFLVQAVPCVVGHYSAKKHFGFFC